MPESLTVKEVREQRSTQLIAESPQSKFCVRNSKQIYVGFLVLLLLQLPLQFTATFFKFRQQCVNQVCQGALDFNAAVNLTTAIYFTAISTLFGIGIRNIWKKLQSNPGLRYRERIMWVILFVIVTYGTLFLLSSLNEIICVALNTCSKLYIMNLSYSLATFRSIALTIS